MKKQTHLSTPKNNLINKKIKKKNIGLSTSIVAMLVTLIMVACASGSVAPKKSAVIQKEKPVSSLANSITGFNYPREGLWTGGQPTVATFSEAKAAGVTWVINLRADGESGFDASEGDKWGALGIEYKRIVVAGKAGVTLDKSKELTVFLNTLSKEKILVHCGSGNRAGALLAIGHFAQSDFSEASKKDALTLGHQAGLKSLTDHTTAVIDEMEKEKSK